jgi:membrane fusion protein (multidrug efflux system)
MSPRTRFILLGTGAVLLGVGAFYGFGWWTHGRFVQHTDDAYLRADQVVVAPKVGGYVEAVYVGDNQPVMAGQPLVKIDTSNYDAVLAREDAALEGRRADVEAARSQIVQQDAAVAQAQAELERAKVNAAYAAGDSDRYKALSGEGVETRRSYDQARHTRDEAMTAVKAAEAALSAARLRVATLKSQAVQAAANVDAQAAAVKSAKINLGDTTLRSSINGSVGDRGVRVGQFVQPGQRLMSIVPVQDVYLVANFKETQIARMKIGQKVEVEIDAIGGKKIDAVIDSFAPGTGAQFALLPPENATGNFTKIVQRVPVRIKLFPPAALRDHLLPGLSASVSVDTTKAPEARR